MAILTGVENIYPKPSNQKCDSPNAETVDIYPAFRSQETPGRDFGDRGKLIDPEYRRKWSEQESKRTSSQQRGGVLLLTIDILHDLIYQDPRNYGSNTSK